ncbi:3133_t:CDS:2, partial [Dentiscutata heterogama]
MTFSDFPIPEERPTYLPNILVAKYFNMYADKFKLWPYIIFRTTVIHVSYLPDHRWKVKYITNIDKAQNEEDHSSEYEEIFDYVMVCNGHHRKYKSACFEDKRVVVVGVGNGGIDIAVELSHVTSQVYLCIRRGTLPWILPRLVGGTPIDQLGSRFSTYFFPNFTSALIKLIVKIVNPHPTSFQQPESFNSSHPTIKSDFFERLKTGTIILTKNILELMPDESKLIKFVDGSIVENIDAIIYSTRFNIDFPFLDREIVNGGPEIEQEFEEEYKENLTWMYKMMFLPKYRNIVFIGLIQPIGALFPIS